MSSLDHFSHSHMSMSCGKGDHHRFQLGWNSTESSNFEHIGSTMWCHRYKRYS